MGGARATASAAKLFLVHFEGTTFVAEDEEGRSERRGSGLGRALYERFFRAARAHGRTLVRCVLPPEAGEAVAFHRALGFEVERVAEDYDGSGEDWLLLVKRL